MRIQEKLHRALKEEREVNKILIEFGAKWWLFGAMCGAVIQWFLMTLNNL